MLPEMEATGEADQYEQPTKGILQCTTRAMAGNDTTDMEAPQCEPVRYCITVGDMRKAL